MIFSDSKAIYEQISERVCDDIISGKYKADGRIPSARDIGANFQVNPNTVVKSFELLARNEIIYYRRGMGYYVSSNALKRILDVRRKNFLGILLPGRACRDIILREFGLRIRLILGGKMG